MTTTEAIGITKEMGYESPFHTICDEFDDWVVKDSNNRTFEDCGSLLSSDAKADIICHSINELFKDAPAPAYDLELLLGDFGVYCLRQRRTWSTNMIAKWANEYVKQLKLK